MLTDSNNFRKQLKKSNIFPICFPRECINSAHIFSPLNSMRGKRRESTLKTVILFILVWIVCFSPFLCSIFCIEGSWESKTQLIYNASQWEDSEEVLRFLGKFVSSRFESWCLLIQTQDSTFNIQYPDVVPCTKDKKKSKGIFFFLSNTWLLQEVRVLLIVTLLSRKA